MYISYFQSVTITGNRLERCCDVNKGADLLFGQGCVFSPKLFTKYENIFREALDGENMVVVLNGEKISTIRYADDIVLLTESKHL